MTLTETSNVSGLNCTLTKSSCYVKTKDAIEITGTSGETLKISFQRTIRVPDGDGESELPPSMGTFPLYSTANYEDKLPPAMALKGGLFMPMYRKSFNRRYVSITDNV